MSGKTLDIFDRPILYVRACPAPIVSGEPINKSSLVENRQTFTVLLELGRSFRAHTPRTRTRFADVTSAWQSDGCTDAAGLGSFETSSDRRLSVTNVSAVQAKTKKIIRVYVYVVYTHTHTYIFVFYNCVHKIKMIKSRWRLKRKKKRVVRSKPVLTPKEKIPDTPPRMHTLLKSLSGKPARLYTHERDVCS